jgi:outer membrane protein TolC
MPHAHRTIVPALLLLSAQLMISCGDQRTQRDRGSPRPGAAQGPIEPQIPSQGVAVMDEPLASRLTVSSCVAYAWRHNRTLARSDWSVRTAYTKLELADAAGRPSLVADGAAGQRSNDPGGTLGGESFVTGDRRVFSSDVELIVPLFNAGDPPGRRDAAGHELDAARHDASRARADVELRVTVACIHLIEVERQAHLLDDSVRMLTEQAQIASDLAQQGLALASDALASQVRAAERQQDRLRAANDRSSAQAHLARLLGVGLDTPVTLIDQPPEVVQGGLDEATLVAQALAIRTDLAAARERVLAAQDGVRAAGAEHLPQLRAVGGYHLDSDSYLLNRQWFSASVELAVPIYDGGIASAHTDAARAQAGERSEESAELCDQIREEVKQVTLDVREVEARVPLADKAETLSAQRLVLVRDQYAHGLADMTTVLSAADEQVRAQLNRLHASADRMRAVARLRYVVGDPRP